MHSCQCALGLNAPCSLPKTECSSQAPGVPGPGFPEAPECGLPDKESQGASHCYPFLHPCQRGLAPTTRVGSSDTRGCPGDSRNQFYPLSCSEVVGGDAERHVHLLVRLSSELLIAPKSGKTIIRTDSCLLFKKQTTKCILDGVTTKPVRLQGDSAKRSL